MEKVIGIIGEGKMGTSIFYYLVGFGFNLVWLVSPAADRDKLKKQLKRKISRSLDAGIIGEEEFNRLEQTIISSDNQSLAGCSLVIEAIPENPELKKKLFSELDTFVHEDCIFASNSSSINPSLLSPASSRREKFVGLHFFYPVQLKNIVEFTTTPSASESTKVFVRQFLETIQRKYLELDEPNSFVLNRLFLDFQNEAYRIVAEGRCTFAQMDQIVKERIFPFGVFDFCDSVGNDTMLAAMKNYTTDYPHREYFSPFIGKLESLCAAGRLGMKTNSGFYDYPLENEEVRLSENSDEIAEHLRFTYLNASKRYTALAHLPVGEMNDAIKEYFGIEKGPFD